jgi:hypothetical protein
MSAAVRIYAAYNLHLKPCALFPPPLPELLLLPYTLKADHLDTSGCTTSRSFLTFLPSDTLLRRRPCMAPPDCRVSRDR